jgi:hypothetical protein
MASAGLLEMMDVGDFAPDLEFAIARALERARAMEFEERPSR